MNQFVCTDASEQVRARLLLGTLYPECKTNKVSHAQIQAQLDQVKALHLLPSSTSIEEFVNICGLKEGTTKRVIPSFFSKLQPKRKSQAQPSKEKEQKRQKVHQKIQTKDIHEIIVISSDSEEELAQKKEEKLTEEELDKILAEVDHTSNKYPERNYIDELLMMERPIDSETEEW